ncbi:MAG TPA: WD40 repeat domain-containing protein [Clostridia bacterium]|nr:WD40 repeat domain-containing protein [Clostridia bacterium]
MKKISFLIFILVILIFFSGCSNLKTPGEAIRPPKNVGEVILQEGNSPLWTIQSEGERFFDTVFLSDNDIVTLVYKEGNIYLRSYKKGQLIGEKVLGSKVDYKILAKASDRFVIKRGESEIFLYNNKLEEILNYKVELEKTDYQNDIIDSILSSDGKNLVVSVVYYDNNLPKEGEVILFKEGEFVKRISNVLPQLATFSDDSKKFLFVDLGIRSDTQNKGKIQEGHIFVYNKDGNLLKKINIPIDLSKATRISATLSREGNAILFSNCYGDKLYVEKDEKKIEIPIKSERFFSNKDATKIVTGNYGVSKIYDGNGELLDYIVINYGIINDVHFEGNNTFFAINGTTIPNSKNKNYVGVMDESGNVIWTAKVYDTVAILKFSPNGKKIMAQSSKFIAVYDYSNGKIDILPRPINGKYPELIWKRALIEETTEDNAFIIGDKSGNIYVARDKTLIKATKNGNQFWVVNTEKPIKFLDVSLNGELIAIVIENYDGSEVIVYDKAGMIVSHKYIIKGHQVTSLSVSLNGKYFSYAVSTPENEEYGSFIDLFNDKGYMIWEQKIKSTYVSNLSITHNTVTACFSDDRSSGYIALDFKGKILYNKEIKNTVPFIKNSINGEIFLLSNNGRNFSFYGREGKNEFSRENQVVEGVIQQVLMSEDGKVVVAASYNKASKNYYITFVDNFEKIKTVVSDWKIKKIIMTLDGEYIVTLSYEYDNPLNNANKITLYDKKGNTLYTYYHKSGIYDIAITQDGTDLYLYSTDGYVYKYRNK